MGGGSQIRLLVGKKMPKKKKMEKNREKVLRCL